MALIYVKLLSKKWCSVLLCKCLNILSSGKELTLCQSNKIWNQSNLKAFADDILIVVQMMIRVTDRIENIVGKGENAGYQHFLLFPQCFQKTPFQGSFKVGIVW